MNKERSQTQTTRQRTTDFSSSYYSTTETDFNTYFNGQVYQWKTTIRRGLLRQERSITFQQ
eukprot:5532054-Amphidinium_carterae.1